MLNQPVGPDRDGHGLSEPPSPFEDLPLVQLMHMQPGRIQRHANSLGKLRQVASPRSAGWRTMRSRTGWAKA